MENHNSQTSNKHVGGRAQWEPADVIIFCDICKKELDDGNRQGGGLKKFSWKTIASKFKNKTGLCYSGP